MSTLEKPKHDFFSGYVSPTEWKERCSALEAVLKAVMWTRRNNQEVHEAVISLPEIYRLQAEDLDLTMWAEEADRGIHIKVTDRQGKVNDTKAKLVEAFQSTGLPGPSILEDAFKELYPDLTVIIEK